VRATAGLVEHCFKKMCGAIAMLRVNEWRRVSRRIGWETRVVPPLAQGCGILRWRTIRVAASELPPQPKDARPTLGKAAHNSTRSRHDREQPAGQANNLVDLIGPQQMNSFAAYEHRSCMSQYGSCSAGSQESKQTNAAHRQKGQCDKSPRVPVVAATDATSLPQEREKSRARIARR